MALLDHLARAYSRRRARQEARVARPLPDDVAHVRDRIYACVASLEAAGDYEALRALEEAARRLARERAAAR